MRSFVLTANGDDPLAQASIWSSCAGANKVGNGKYSAASSLVFSFSSKTAGVSNSREKGSSSQNATLEQFSGKDVFRRTELTRIWLFPFDCNLRRSGDFSYARLWTRFVFGRDSSLPVLTVFCALILIFSSIPVFVARDTAGCHTRAFEAGVRSY